MPAREAYSPPFAVRAMSGADMRCRFSAPRAPQRGVTTLQCARCCARAYFRYLKDAIIFDCHCCAPEKMRCRQRPLRFVRHAAQKMRACDTQRGTLRALFMPKIPMLIDAHQITPDLRLSAHHAFCPLMPSFTAHFTCFRCLPIVRHAMSARARRCAMLRASAMRLCDA